MEIRFSTDLTTGASPLASGTNQPSNEASRRRIPKASRAELSQKERRELAELKRRDREVRAHERAHKLAAGAHARGGPVYQYEQGPDGRSYAVSGEVTVDASEVAGNPQATITKMRIVRRAALAPERPSARDRQVAAEASRKERGARADLAEERQERSREADASHAEVGGESRFHLGDTVRSYRAFTEPSRVLDVRA